MASSPWATSPSNLWCLLVFSLVYLFHATESLSADGNRLLRFKNNIFDIRGRLDDWYETDANPCNWTGVTCRNDSTLRVTGLDLKSFKLSGTISSSLCDLEDLVTLVLSGNSLSGEIPGEISSLPGLISLRLEDNGLTGTIPSLPGTLLFLTLQNNFLTGSISAVEGLRLFELDLHGNRLSGPLSDSMNWSSTIENLDLSGNLLEGALPSFFASLGELSYMNMSSNKFTGQIPQGPWRTPAVLDLSRNQLSGRIPGELFASRTYLNVSTNFLSGTIDIQSTQPTFFGYIAFLDLSNNQLSGPLPGLLATSLSGSLQFLCLQNNQLEGSLQSIFSANFSSLRELRLSGNRLTVGTLPLVQVHSFPRLQVLELGQSNVEGELRPEVFNNATLPFLKVLDLSGNRLQGPIPAGLMQMPSLQELRLAGNDLTGDITAASDSTWKDLVVLDISRNRLTWNSSRDANILQTIFSSYLSLTELRLGSNLLASSLLPTRIELTRLETLDLSYSNLEGTISAETYSNAFLPSLKYLDLSNNQLHGQVPNSFVQMPTLTSLNLANNNLSGPLPLFPGNLFNSSFYSGNPGLCGPPLRSCFEGQQSGGIQLWLVITIVAACLVLSGASCVLLGWRWRIEAAKHKQDEELIAALLDRDTTSLMPLRDLKKATDNFSQTFQIGVGGFGTVYAGTLDNGSKVAIKRSHRQGTAEDKCQFLNEVKILSQVHHRNLVRLLGCCLANKVALLVFEYVPNGTLEEHLRRKKGSPPLSWRQRLLIAVQTADALNYLHSSANPPIYHLDVKSANILLDENLNAKVADFGISKLAPGLDATHVTALGLQGTIGYMDPETVVSAQLTGKSDVYAFGVVLLELISAKAAVDRTRGDGPEVSLLNWATPLIEEGKLEELIDPALSNTFYSADGKDLIVRVARLAIRCSNFSSRSRPSMQEVWQDLHKIWLLSSDTCTPTETVVVDVAGEKDTNSLLTVLSNSSEFFGNTGSHSELALSVFGR